MITILFYIIDFIEWMSCLTHKYTHTSPELIYSDEHLKYLEESRLFRMRKKEIIAELDAVYPNREWWKWDNTVHGSCVLISDNEEYVRVMSFNYEHYLAVKSNVEIVQSDEIPTKERIENIKNIINEKVKANEEKKNNVIKNIEEFEQIIEEDNYVDSDNSNSDSGSGSGSGNDVFNDLMTVINNSNSGVYDAEAKKRADFVKNLKFVYCEKEIYDVLNKERATFSKDSQLLIKNGYMTYNDYIIYYKGIDVREKIFEFVERYLKTHEDLLGKDFVLQLCDYLESCGFSKTYVQTAVRQFIDDFNKMQ